MEQSSLKVDQLKTSTFSFHINSYYISDENTCKDIIWIPEMHMKGFYPTLSIPGKLQLYLTFLKQIDCWGENDMQKRFFKNPVVTT